MHVSERTSYSRQAILIHWIVALLLVVQFLAGWNLDAHDAGMPAGPISNLHASLGIAIGLLVLYRLAARVTHKVPQLARLPVWQRHAAETVHILLLLMLIVMPAAGIVTALNEGAAFTIFGFIPLPLMTPSEGLADIMEETHEIGATILMALIGLHVAAALYHHFVRKDDVLRRMLPFS